MGAGTGYVCRSFTEQRAPEIIFLLTTEAGLW